MSDLLNLAIESEVFETRIERLPAGDYILNDRVAIERKTFRDFAFSVIDGRLFAQAAALKRLPQRALILLEGPKPRVKEMPRVHPRALKGALLSLAVSWRLPVVYSRGAFDSLVCLEILAEQSQVPGIRRYPLGFRANPHSRGAKSSQILQALPAVGPRLAERLLRKFGSVKKVILADVTELAQVPGCGPKKAAGIREALEATVFKTGKRTCK